MRTALTAFISAASLCALGSVASAQTYYYGAPPTIASNTGTPAYSYETQVPPQPAFNGSCDIISGNRVCSAAPAYVAPAPAYAPAYGPLGAVVVAPFNAAGTVLTAPFGMFGATPGTQVVYGNPGTPYIAGTMTNPAATGTKISSYESHVGVQPGAVGYCELISGNHVCMP